MCFDKKQKNKSSETVTTPAPTQGETDAQNLATQIQQLNLWKGGFETYRDTDGTLQLRERAPTDDELASQRRDREIEDIAFRKLKGEVTPEEQALIDTTYGSAIETGKSDVRAEFDRSLEQLRLGEDRGYQDIQTELQRGTEEIDKHFMTDAAERGLSQGATPIFGERADKFRQFGEDVNKTSSRLFEDVGRNKRLLGEDLTRNVTDLETSLLGAKSAATMDVMGRGQLFGQALNEFKQGLQQQSFLNRQMIGESFQNSAMGLGNLRSRNYTRTGSNTTTVSDPMGTITSLMGGGGGLLKGIGGLMKP